MNENVKSEKKRDVANDVVRIVAMLLVIGVHWFGSLTGFWPEDEMAAKVFTFIGCMTRFGVPIFFSLSGYYMLGQEIKDIKAFYYKRFVRVIVPYLLYAVLYVFYFTIFEDHEPTLLLKNYIVNILTGNVHPTHWFVYSILGLYFATPFLSRMFARLTDKEVMSLYVTALMFSILNGIFGLFGYTFGINTTIFEGTLLTFISGYCTDRCFRAIGADKWKYISFCKWAVVAALFILFCISEQGCLICIIAGLIPAGNGNMNVKGISAKVITLVSSYSYSVYLAHAAVISAVLRVFRDWSRKLFGLKVVAGYIIVFVASLCFALFFDTICTNRLTGALERHNKSVYNS